MDLSNNYFKIIHIVPYIYRFLHNCRSKVKKRPLTTSEIPVGNYLGESSTYSELPREVDTLSLHLRLHSRAILVQDTSIFHILLTTRCLQPRPCIVETGGERSLDGENLGRVLKKGDLDGGGPRLEWKEKRRGTPVALEGVFKEMSECPSEKRFELP
ncbi:hypothetical protein TNCV_4894911 [Trichonephila clavipes]|nr:hypothetical protein TNCV_4894911 [Trichonephila clavipes]